MNTTAWLLPSTHPGRHREAKGLTTRLLALGITARQGRRAALMALADEVTKLSAVCMVCGAPAIHTQRLGQSQELVVVGAAGLYEARCRTHFEPFSDEHHSEQLDLLTA